MRFLLLVASLFFSLGCVETAPIEGLLCSTERPCPSTYGCIGGRCRTVPDGIALRCGEDDQCPIGVCLEGAGFCVQCTTDEHCPFGVCLEGAQVCGCRRDRDCVTGRCDESRGICLSCFSDAQCGKGRCDPDTGYCVFSDETAGTAERKI